MEVLNYTGTEIGLMSKSGRPIAVLYPEGNPKCEISVSLEYESDNLIPIYTKTYGKVTGLPSPDPNRETYYIVNEDIINALGRTRTDLLLPTGPILYQGANYYKTLVLPS